ERTHVAPGLEVVRFVDVPVTPVGGFVVVEAEVDAGADLVQRLRELEIRGRREDGIRPEDEQHVHLARRISSTSVVKDCTPSAGDSAIGAVYVTVEPVLPSASLIARAIACTAAGWRS